MSLLFLSVVLSVVNYGGEIHHQTGIEKQLFVAQLNLAVGLPIDYGNELYDAAVANQVDKYELAATLIAEHAGPDYDFSLGTARKYRKLNFDPLSEGKSKERGLFQIKPSWAKKAGVNADDLFDPYINIQVGAFVVKTNQAKHAKACAHKKYQWHSWYAHYTCHRRERDQLQGFCRFKQLRYEKILHSLTEATPDFKTVVNEYNAALKATRKRAERDSLKSSVIVGVGTVESQDD